MRTYRKSTMRRFRRRRPRTTRINVPSGARFRRARNLLLARVSGPQVHSFKRSTAIVTGASTGTGIGAGTFFGIFSPQLNQLPNVSEFGALYDQYKINYVVYRIIWRSTGVSTIETRDHQNIGAPYMLWALDRDDSNVPTTITQLREYANCKEFIFTPDKRECYVKFKPSTLTQVYQSNIATSYNIQYGKYLDIADGGATPYYGAKLAIVSPNSGSPDTAQLFDIHCTMYFTMKCPR